MLLALLLGSPQLKSATPETMQCVSALPRYKGAMNEPKDLDKARVVDAVGSMIRRSSDPEVRFDEHSDPFGKDTTPQALLSHPQARTADGARQQFVSCVNSVRTDFVYRGSDVGYVVASLCRLPTEITLDGICAAQAFGAYVISQLSPEQRLMLEKIPPNAYAAREADGSLIEYLPVASVGHGVSIVPTIILMNPKWSHLVLVQGSLTNLCSRAPQAVVCENADKVLTSIAREVARTSF